MIHLYHGYVKWRLVTKMDTEKNTGKIRVGIFMDVKLRRALKALAASIGMDMSELAENILRREIAARKRPKGLK